MSTWLFHHFSHPLGVTFYLGIPASVGKHLKACESDPLLVHPWNRLYFQHLHSFPKTVCIGLLNQMSWLNLSGRLWKYSPQWEIAMRKWAQCAQASCSGPFMTSRRLSVFRPEALTQLFIMWVIPHPTSHKLINHSLFWQGLALSAFIRWYKERNPMQCFFVFFVFSFLLDVVGYPLALSN